MTLPDDRVKHLEFIQATIARQASHSFAVKGWSLTVSAAVYAYSAGNLQWWLAIVAMLPPVAFGWLDAFYLRQERLFRALYDAAIQPNAALPIFSMDTSAYRDASAYPRCSRKSVRRANTWRVFHGLIAVVGLFLLGVALFKVFRGTEFADCVRGVF